LQIYAKAGDDQKRMAFDEVRPLIEAEFARSPLATALSFDQAFKEPSGMEAYRAFRAAAATREGQRREEVIGAEAEQK
jgi:hypothetical protein